MLLQCGFEVTHKTIRAWEFRVAPLLVDRLRAKRRGRVRVLPRSARPSMRYASTSASTGAEAHPSRAPRSDGSPSPAGGL